MAAGVAGDRISERLQESLARLREDIDRVELWAGALEGFLRPIPEYDAARRYRLRDENNDGQDKTAQRYNHSVTVSDQQKAPPRRS